MYYQITSSTTGVCLQRLVEDTYGPDGQIITTVLGNWERCDRKTGFREGQDSPTVQVMDSGKLGPHAVNEQPLNLRGNLRFLPGNEPVMNFDPGREEPENGLQFEEEDPEPDNSGGCGCQKKENGDCSCNDNREKIFWIIGGLALLILGVLATRKMMKA